MDEDRRMRFLLAHILFVASLAWGALSDHDFLVAFPTRLHWWCSWCKADGDWSKLIGLVAGGGFVVFVAGYVIGTLTVFFLQLFFCISYKLGGRWRFHEVAMSPIAFVRVWNRVGAPSKNRNRARELFAGVVFDYDVLRKDYEGVHRWLMRRWTAFNIGATSVCGLLLSLAFGYFVIGIPLAYAWWLPVVGFALILAFVASVAWCDTMNMVNFMASLPLKARTVELGSSWGNALHHLLQIRTRGSR